MMQDSLTGRRWVVNDVDEAKAQSLAEQYDLSPLAARMLVARAIDETSLNSFLNPRLRDLLPDPSEMAEMDDAVSFVAAAVKNKQPIALYGDYDVDGISSVALLKNYFTALGCATETYLPDRMLDGYGLNKNALAQIKSKGYHLIITVDCGAKDIEALEYAKQEGIDMIVLDHHPTDQAPPARAFVNPNNAADQSGLGDLTAVGVSFMFLVGLNRFLRKTYDGDLPDLMKSLDLVALGTICDVAPLTGLNRAFVIRGQELLAARNNAGLAILGATAGMRGKPNVESFSFTLGPRINAAGRIGKADLALALLTSDDEQELKSLAAQLNTLNRQRQAIEKTILNEAVARLQAQQKKKPLEDAIVIAGEGWHVGVIGIIAARLRDLYERPVAVIAQNGEQAVGSVRGGGGAIDLGVIIQDAAHLLMRGGGHRQAAGFTIAPDKIDAFTNFFINACAAKKTNQQNTHQIDASLDFSAANRALYEELQKIAPFGKGNPHPCILFTDGRLMHTRVSGNGHLRCRFQPAGGGRAVEVVGFRQASTALGLTLQNAVGEIFHIAGFLRPAWQNMASDVEISLEDAVPAKTADAA